MQPSLRGLNILQKISMSLMGVLVMITFIGANLHAIFWQSSDWLVSTVLPAVVVQLTNEERADNAAAPLQRNSTLDAAAKLKAEHMAQNEYFSHFSPDGVSPWYWFEESGYVYAHAGENLAIHFTDSSEVVEAWMKSPTHRQNIVNGSYTEIGVGTAKGEFEGYKTVYVVQLFGSPAVAPTPTPTPTPTTPQPEPVLAVADVPTTLGSAVESETVAATQIDEPVVPEEILIEEPVQVPVPVETLVAPETVAEANELVIDEVPEPITQVAVTEDVIEEVTILPEEVVIIESPIISTSSGLAIANITTPNNAPAKASVASIATQPNELLQIMYLTLGAIVFLLLAISIVMEARRLHFVQVSYGILLLFGMTGLWYAHSLLTSGAVIV